MSRDLLQEDYYVSHGGKIPVKWTAPEVYEGIKSKIFVKYSPLCPDTGLILQEVLSC